VLYQCFTNKHNFNTNATRVYTVKLSGGRQKNKTHRL